MKPSWWPQSPNEASMVLVRMRDCLVFRKRDIIKGFAVIIGILLAAVSLGAWERGSNAAGWTGILVLATMMIIITSSRLHEAILRIPLTEDHLNEFERQIDDYKAAGLWLPVP